MKLSVDKVKIGIHFEIGEPPHVLQDTLFFTEEEYAALTPEQINAMKVDRYQKWRAIVTAPYVEPEEVVENTSDGSTVTE